MSFCRRFTIKSIPAARGIVTAVITLSITVMVTTVSIVVLVARQSRRFTVVAVKETFFSVTSFITGSVLEHVPTVFTSASCNIAKLPGIETKAAISAVVVADVSVALLVAAIVALLVVTTIFDTFLKLLLVVDDLVLAVCQVNASGRSFVRDFTVLSSPFWFARAVKITYAIYATAILTRIVCTFITGVLFTSFASCASWAEAFEVRSMIKAGASIKTGLVFTTAAEELTVGTAVTSWANSGMPSITVGAHSPILARAVLAEVSFGLAVPAHKSRLADAVVAVYKLNAFLSSTWRART